MTDNVNNPAHYGGKDNPFETIKVLEAWLTPQEVVGFLKGNVIKYQSRANAKNGAEDYAKSSWYANRLAEFIKTVNLPTAPVVNPKQAEADGKIIFAQAAKIQILRDGIRGAMFKMASRNPLRSTLKKLLEIA
ncbi:DUF3310 domain-containing protein [Bradyrhizobium sp. Tv2a-2]|uniref:DUF3310 domain-containing protein n=1 Tax=Bradyrhizobium sp. Tv2a-2 TaxID=113395 RepID=UPI000403A2B9|nr:DUF3310 domain-containing protein [Bradyrhizobium sp. Tv2a-2]